MNMNVPAEFQSQSAAVTERQLTYLLDLIDTREFAPKDGKTKDDLRAEARGLSKADASRWIERLKSLPRAARVGQGGPGVRFPVHFELLELDGGQRRELGFVTVNGAPVPQGKYALDVADLGWANEIAFFNLYVARDFQTNEPFYSLKMYASDDLMKMPNDRQREVLGRIAVDPGGASRLYGQHKVRCGVCNRKLTNDDSRALGIGPVCRARLSW